MAKTDTDKGAAPDLRLVGVEAEIYDLMKAPVSTADRVKRLQLEARALALEEVEALATLLNQAAAKAREIAEGGDAYPVGAREIAHRLASDLPAKAENIHAVTAKAPLTGR